jgi:ABC-type uncharacterized transport system
VRSALHCLLFAALALIALGASQRLAGRIPSARVELARLKPTELTAATRARLATLDAPVVLTWFSSPAERAPSHWGGMSAQVALLLDALQRTSKGKLRYERVDPDASPELAAYAAQCKVKPLRVRTVTHDAWSERSVWSTLSIAYGSRPRAQLAGIAPENAELLQSRLVAQLDELENPRKPVVGLDAPARGFERLAARLAQHAEVVPVRVGSGGLDPRCDLLFLVADGPVPNGADRDVLELIERGKSAVVAVSRWRPLPQAEREQIAFADTDLELDPLLGALGVDTPPALVLDTQCEVAHDAPTPRPLSWRVRSIAPNQDFRALQGQPNSTLVFEAPCALLPDADRLDELALDLTPLATGGPEAWTLQPPSGAVAIDSLTPAATGAGALPKPTLAALLAPRDPLRGSVVLLGSSNPLRDGELDREDAAHAALVDILLASLTSPERLVSARLSIPRAESLPPLDPGARNLWRAICIALVPAVCAIAFVVRARGRASRAVGRSTARAIGGVALGFVAWIAISALASAIGGLELDLTRAGLHELDPKTCELAAKLDSPLRAELCFSRSLPPALADLPVRLEDSLRSIGGCARFPLQLRHVEPAELDAAARAGLERRGAGPLAARVRGADETSFRQIHSTLLLACGEREVALSFPDAASAEPLELRLAMALGRLAGDKEARGRVVVVADTPRLSPAEAHLEFEQKGRFAPTGADVFSQARQLLQRADFEVITRSPQSTEPLGDVDLLVWLQPRRGIEPTLEALAAHLSSGGRALVAAQHFDVRSRQLAGEGFRTVHWPEPQFPDIEKGWLADLGVTLVREVLCDSSNASLELPTEVERPGEGRDFVLQTSALPVQIRALASRFATDTPLVVGLGDQLFLWGNRIALDRQRLVSHALTADVLMTTSEGAWAIEWQGGYLDPQTLAGPPEGKTLGAQPLAVRVRGRFPWLAGEPGTRAGELVLIGCSEMFTSAHLEREPFRADQLLLNSAATLALSEDYGRIAARRPVVAGFAPLDAGQRMAWRAIAVGAWPALIALFGLVWNVLRRRGAPAALVTRTAP